MTIRQSRQRKFAATRFSASKHRTMAAQEQSQDPGKLQLQSQIAQLPSRPDDTVLSESIPLFFIGRNQRGFWIARESAGRCGGLFLFRWSAARFARSNGLAGACATMLVQHSIELDLPNQGNRLVELIAATTDIVKRRTPFVTNLISVVIAGWRRLDAQISRALADHRRNREAMETDLFGGEYKLVSKNDDDLPIQART